MMKPYCILFSTITGLLSILTINIVNPQPSHAKSRSSQCLVNHVDNTKSGISQTFEVNKKRVKIRTAPNTDSGIAKMLHRGDIIEGINESGWIKMTNGNYVCAQYLKPIDPTPIDPTPINPTPIETTQASPIVSPPQQLAANQASPIIAPPQQLSATPVNQAESTITPNQPASDSEFSIHPQILINCLIFGSVVMVIVIAYSSGHSEGHTEGNTQGNTQGNAQGYNKGYQKGHSDGYDKASGEHTVEIIPVYYAKNNKFLGFGSHCIKQGYFYQTYIKGMPSVKSEFIQIKTIEVNEINKKELLELTKDVVKIAMSLHPHSAIAGLPQKIIEAQAK